MNTRHAQIILAILRHGSFTAAAKALSITQPTLSQTVRQIETQFGESIFVRGHTPIALTPAGELYVQAARRIVQTETQLQEALHLLRGHARGTIRIGLQRHRSDELLPQVLNEFYNAYPDVQLEACEETAACLEQRLLQDELDMALLASEKHLPGLEYRQIAAEEIVLLAGRNTELAKRIPSGSTIGLREAEHERFILPSLFSPGRKYYDELLPAISAPMSVWYATAFPLPSAHAQPAAWSCSVHSFLCSAIMTACEIWLIIIWAQTLICRRFIWFLPKNLLLRPMHRHCFPCLPAVSVP